MDFPDGDHQADTGSADQPENHILINGIELTDSKRTNRGINPAEHTRPTKLKPGGTADLINIGFANATASAIGHSDIDSARQHAKYHVVLEQRSENINPVRGKQRDYDGEHPHQMLAIDKFIGNKAKKAAARKPR